MSTECVSGRIPGEALFYRLKTVLSAKCTEYDVLVEHCFKEPNNPVQTPASIHDIRFASKASIVDRSLYRQKVVLSPSEVF
jgi:hypothetical protein